MFELENSSYLWALENITALKLMDAMASDDDELSNSWADVLGMLIEVRKRLREWDRQLNGMMSMPMNGFQLLAASAISPTR